MSKFDALSLDVDRPHRVLLFKPDGTEWCDKDGNRAWIDIVSPDSERNAVASREINDRRMAGETLASDADIRARLPYLTVGWYLLDFQGNVLTDTYSLDEAKDLYGARGRDFLARQVIAEAFNTANFMPAQPSA